MALTNTWELDTTNLILKRTSGTAVDTVQDLYSWVQDQIDESALMDDSEPMSAQTTTAYSVGKISASATQPWFLNIDSTKYLKGGAISTTGYDGYIVKVAIDTQTTQAQASDIGKVVSDDAAAVGPLVDFETINSTEQIWWIRDNTSPPHIDGDIADGSTMTIASSSADGDSNGASVTGEGLFANIYTLGTIESTPAPQVYVVQDGETLSEWSDLGNWDRGHIDVLISVKEAGVAIDSQNLTVFARAGLDLYDHFEITTTSAGQNAVPLSTANDLNHTNPDYYIFYDAGNGTDFTVGEVIEEDTAIPDWTAEVCTEDEWTAGIGVLGITNFKGTIADGDTFTGASSGGTGTINSSGTGSLGTAYIYYDNWGTSDMTLGDAITGGSSGAKRELIGLYEDAANTSGYLLMRVDPTVTGANRDPYYRDFTDNEQITDEGTATADVDLATTGSAMPNAVAGYDDITVAFVNGTCTTGGTTGTFTPGEVVTWNDGSAQSAIVLLDSASVLTLGNCTATTTQYLMTGAISGATATPSQDLQSAHTMNKNFSQQSAYPYDVIMQGGDIYEAGRTMAEIYEYLKFLCQEDSTFSMYTVVATVITVLDGEEYIQAYTGYTPVKAAPFGTLAGGKFFGAQGIWIEGMATSQSYQYIDSNGDGRQPFSEIAIKITDLLAGDRGAVFITTAGVIEKDMYQSHASSNAQGDNDLVHDGTPATATDTPDDGAVRIVDASENVEYRIRYDSWTGSTFSFPTEVTALTDTADATGTQCKDADGNFVVNGIVAGDLIVNQSDGYSWAQVTSVAAGQVDHTPLQGGTNQDWDSGDTYSFHTLPQALVAADTIYVPYIDAEASGTSLEVTVLYDTDKTVMARVRKKGIIPFETTGTVDSAGYTVAAIRTTDNIVV